MGIEQKADGSKRIISRPTLLLFIFGLLPGIIVFVVDPQGSDAERWFGIGIVAFIMAIVSTLTLLHWIEMYVRRAICRGSGKRA